MDDSIIFSALGATKNLKSDGTGEQCLFDDGTYKSVPAGTVVVDSSMSDSSTNPVQNKVAKSYTDNAVKTFTALEVSSTKEDRKLSSEGLAAVDGTRRLTKFAVTEGNVYKVVGAESWQFQATDVVPANAPSKRIEQTYTGDGTETAPNTAMFIICAALKTDTVTVYLVSDKFPSNESVESLTNKVEYRPAEYVWQDGKYLSSAGNIGTMSGYSIAKVTVASKAKLTVRTRLNSTSFGFFDNDDTFISTYTGDTSANVLTDYEMIVPDKAVYALITCLTGVKSGFKAEVVDLKDTIFNNSKRLSIVENCFLSTANPLDTINDDPKLLRIFHKVGIIGDSLGSGEIASNETGSNALHDIYEYSWGQCLARATGNTYYNFTNGGCTTKSWLETQRTIPGMIANKTWLGQATDGEHDCQLYFLGLGINDEAHSDDFPLGTIADINDADADQNAQSFYGYYGKIIQKLTSHILGENGTVKPKFFCFGIPMRSVNRPDLASYDEAIEEIAEHFDNCYYMDLYQYAANLYNDYKNHIITSGAHYGHYCGVAYYLQSKIIQTYANWIIQNNIDDFTQVEFIGTDYSWTSEPQNE